MKKTDKMASIGQYNGISKKYTYINRRVFEDSQGRYCVRINGSFIEIEWLIRNGRKVYYYYED